MTDEHAGIWSRVDAAMQGRPRILVAPHETDRLYALHRDHPEGCEVRLAAGLYSLDRTVLLPSNLRIVGEGVGRTVITLQPGSNCHMFSNLDHKRGNQNLFVAGLSAIGNGDSQERPAGHKPLTFACAFYFKNARNILAMALDFSDIRQTALHFSACMNVACSDVAARKLGWSGVSTTSTSNIYVHARVEDAGRDVMHSGIHMDGGIGVYVDAEVGATTGNGVMIDSANSPLIGCAVFGRVEGCKRGVSLRGSATHALRNVAISGDFQRNTDAGIMVSNADNVTVTNSRITGNAGYGILFQGRNGGNGCTVANCDISGNGTDIGHLHASNSNWIFPRKVDLGSFLGSDVNQRALQRQLGVQHPWFS